METKKKRIALVLMAVGLITGVVAFAATQTVKQDNDSVKDKQTLQIKSQYQPSAQASSAKIMAVDPFSEMATQMQRMQRMMQQFNNDPFFNIRTVGVRPSFTNGVGSSFNSPKVKFLENKNDYIMQVVTPGMDKKNLTIELKNDILTVSGKNSIDSESKDGDNKVISQQQIVSNFTQSFSIPEDVDCGKISSKYSNGVLTITLPKDLKKIEERTKSIQIN